MKSAKRREKRTKRGQRAVSRLQDDRKPNGEQQAPTGRSHRRRSRHHRRHSRRRHSRRHHSRRVRHHSHHRHTHGHNLHEVIATQATLQDECYHPCCFRQGTSVSSPRRWHQRVAPDRVHTAQAPRGVPRTAAVATAAAIAAPAAAAAGAVAVLFQHLFDDAHLRPRTRDGRCSGAVRRRSGGA